MAFKEATKKDLPKIRTRMLKNIKTDEGIARNDEIIENLEDSFGVDLTSFFGEEDPKRINQLINKLKK